MTAVPEDGAAERPSLLRRIGPAAGALASGALLVDAAVETFLSGSPVRWWTLAAVAAILAAAWLLRARIGWAERAALGALGILALLALTTWLPGGTREGVALLGQPTSVVLSLGTALAAVAAGALLVRVRRVPTLGKAALAALVLYALAAYAWGAVRRIPYPDLVAGSGMPPPFPFWLHGAVVGTFLLLPAALVLRLVEGAQRVRGRPALARWGAGTAAFALVLSVGVAGARTAAASVDGETSPKTGMGLHGEFAAGAEGELTPPPTGDYGSARDSLLSRLRELRSRASGVERPATSPADIAALLGHDPFALLSFVRAAVRFEPYEGVLRGPEGVLAAGGGNAVEMALLLRQMIRSGPAPLPTRFAAAELSTAEAEARVRRAMAQPPARPAAAGAPAASPAPRPGRIPSDAARRLRRDATRAHHPLLRARAELEWIGALLPDVTRDPRETAARAARTHVWLEIERDGEWMALDPTGDSPQAERTFDELPEAWHHRVALKVEVERLTGDRLVREELGGGSWRTAELTDGTLEVALAPEGFSVDAMISSGRELPELADGFERFTVSLGPSGDEPVAVKSFDLTGRAVGESGGPLGGIGAVDVFGRLPRGGRTAEPADDRLTAVWLTLYTLAPDGTRHTVRRALLDRIGPAARAAGGGPPVGPLADATATRVALIQRHQVLVATGRVGLERLAADALAGMVAGDALEHALALRYGETAPSQAALDDPPVPRLPTDLVQVSDVALETVAADLAGEGIAFLGEPGLLIRSETLLLRERGELALRAGIDVARLPVRVLASPGAVRRARLLHGLLLSELEGDALGGKAAGVTSAAGLLRSAREQRIPMELVRDTEDLERLRVPDDARAVMAAELSEGHVLLAPARAVRAGGTETLAWWRLDPQGHVVAVGEDGRGQATEGLLVLKEISIPSVKRTMKFVSCLNKAIAAGGDMNESAGQCMSQAIQDIVKSTLDKAIDHFIKTPIQGELEGAAFPGEYQELYAKAKAAWERFQLAQQALEDPLGTAIDQVPGLSDAMDAGEAASDAGQEIGGAFGFRVYLLLTMGSEIAEYGAKL